MRSGAATRVNVAQCRARENRGENIDENSVTRGERRSAAQRGAARHGTALRRVCATSESMWHAYMCTRVLLVCSMYTYMYLYLYVSSRPGLPLESEIRFRSCRDT